MAPLKRLAGIYIMQNSMVSGGGGLPLGEKIKNKELGRKKIKKGKEKYSEIT